MKSNLERAREALARAEGSGSVLNYQAIFDGFEAIGIEPDDIEPRVNVLTYDAWRAKGRHVRRGARGVKVTTWVPSGARRTQGGPSTEDSDSASSKRNLRPKTTTVFHISQTDPNEGPGQTPTMDRLNALSNPESGDV